MRKIVATLALLAIAIPSAHAMSVAEFLIKADALKAKGLLAMTSPDLGLLQKEVKSASTDYRADLASAKAAGKPLHSCPPPQGKANISSDDVMAQFRAIPEAEKSRTSVKAAFYAIMKKRYPCR